MFKLNYRARLALALAFALSGAPVMAQQPDPLPSWNDGPAKRAILEFVHATTEPGSPDFVPPEDRLATFDQDGTLWVEHPIYSQLAFAFDRVGELAPEHPEWKDKEPFKTVLSGDRAAMAKLSLRDLMEIVLATHAGVTVEAFAAIAADWAGKAKDPRWGRPYTELVYQPMLEVLRLLRANGYRAYIVTGGGQEFVRSYAERVYGIGPAEVIGSTLELKYGYDAAGEGVLLREPKLQLDNNNSGKPEDIHLFTGERPRAAFGNSTGDREMLEWATAGAGKRLGMLVLHDDQDREYAYGPAAGLPDSKVGTFTQALHDEAGKRGWVVISMHKDWKRIFAWEAP
jgi:phosphoserine phosphatase